MSMFFLALTLAMQTSTAAPSAPSSQPIQSAQPAPSPPSQPLREEFPPAAHGLSPAHDIYYEQSNKLSRATRAQLDSFGACVAERSSARASAVLSRDFTTVSYRNGLRQLTRNNYDCYRTRARLRSNLVFAGAIAEQLLEREASPLNVRLAHAALQPATPAYSAADFVAICVVRSVPDEVARLFASPIDSESEAEAARALATPVTACSSGGPRIRVTTAALRAILATAAFRTLNPLSAATASAEPN